MKVDWTTQAMQMEMELDAAVGSTQRSILRGPQQHIASHFLGHEEEQEHHFEHVSPVEREEAMDIEEQQGFDPFVYVNLPDHVEEDEVAMQMELEDEDMEMEMDDEFGGRYEQDYAEEEPEFDAMAEPSGQYGQDYAEADDESTPQAGPSSFQSDEDQEFAINKLPSGKWECDLCKAEYTRNGDVKRHIKSSHLGEKVRCEKCGKGFSRADILLRHRVTCGTGKRRSRTRTRAKQEE